MKFLDSIIIKYLDKETEHSLFINGKWGSGKTYYIKNDLVMLLKNRNKKLIYTSANGIQSFDEIMTQIISSKFVIAKLGDNKLARVAFGILQTGTKIGLKLSGAEKAIDFFSNFKIKKEDLINLKDDVLLIDDVERINFKRLPIADFLGTINNLFTEHSNIKVILVSDETELLKSLEDKEEKNYRRIKEKTIWRTINYRQETELTITNFIDKLRINNDAKEFLNSQNEYLNNLILKSKTDNLRNIKYFLEVVEDVLNVIDLDKFKKIPNQIFQSTFIMTKEYKDGYITPEQYEEAPDYIKSTKAFGEFIFSEGKINIKPSDQNVRNLNNEYSDLFKSTGNYYVFFNSIFRQITIGYLNKELLLLETDGIISNQDIETEWNKSLNKIMNFRFISNEEFITNYAKVLKYVNEGKYSIYSILKFLNFSIYFVETGIKTSFVDVDNLIEFTSKQLHKAELSTNYEHWRFEDLPDSQKAKYPKLSILLDEAQKIHNKILRHTKIEYAIKTKDKLLASVHPLEKEAFRKMMIYIPLTNLNEIIMRYKNDNAFANEFNSLVEQEWYINLGEKETGVDNFNYIIDSLNSTIEEVGTITKFHLRELENILKSKA